MDVVGFRTLLSREVDLGRCPCSSLTETAGGSGSAQGRRINRFSDLVCAAVDSFPECCTALWAAHAIQTFVWREKWRLVGCVCLKCTAACDATHQQVTKRGWLLRPVDPDPGRLACFVLSHIVARARLWRSHDVSGGCDTALGSYGTLDTRIANSRSSRIADIAFGNVCIISNSAPLLNIESYKHWMADVL